MREGAQQIRIGVYGGGVCTDEIYEKARKVGKLLASRGAVVYCGGLGGVMKAVSQGVSEENGTVVGILPGRDSRTANPYTSIPVATGTGNARNTMIANSVHGAIAIDGQYGTLSEIALTLGQNKSVVGLHTWGIKGVVGVKSPEEAVSRILELI